MTPTFLDLRVGPFRLALKADCVMGVLTEVQVRDRVRFRGSFLPFCDLGALFCNTRRSRVPFGVSFEHHDGSAIIGVDTVDHMRLDETLAVERLPAFGLEQPDLFEGVLRDPKGPLLVLRPSVLAGLTTSK